MEIQTIKTVPINKPQILETYVKQFLPKLEENTIIAITSKVVSICEGRCISKEAIDRETLVKREADFLIPNPQSNNQRIILTYKNHILIPSAGIDESNGNGCYILYPKDPFASVKKLWNFLRQEYQIKNLGIIMTDSHTTPLRKGVTGIALAWWGFCPVKSCVGELDLFGHPLQVTYINVADALAISAVLNMGESNECTPLAILTHAPHVQFDAIDHSVEEICIDPKEDLYHCAFPCT